MPKCPHCEAEVESLQYRVMEEHTYAVTLAGDRLHYEGEHRQEAGEGGQYLCPECEEVLFTMEEKAWEFFGGRPQTKCSGCGKDLWGRGMVYQVRMGQFDQEPDGDREFFPEEEVGYYCGNCLQKGV